MSSWVEILSEEQRYLSGIGHRLAEFQTSLSGNLAMEQIYSALWHAYQEGIKSLHVFEDDMGQIDQAVNTGRVHMKHAQILRDNEIPQDRWVAALHIIACMRCMSRPSDIFRTELKRQSSSIIGSLQKIVKDPAYQSEDLISDMHTIGTLICSFDIVPPDEGRKGESIFKRFMKPEVMGAAALAGLGTYLVMNNTPTGKNPKRKQNFLESIGLLKPRTPNPVMKKNPRIAIKEEVGDEEEENDSFDELDEHSEDDACEIDELIDE